MLSRTDTAQESADRIVASSLRPSLRAGQPLKIRPGLEGLTVHGRLPRRVWIGGGAGLNRWHAL